MLLIVMCVSVGYYLTFIYFIVDYLLLVIFFLLLVIICDAFVL